MDRLLRLRPENRERLVEASEVVGRDLARHYAGPNPFATNRDIQIGVFVANQLALDALEAAGITAELSLGLSLGEYNHLVHIGCLSFAAALKLVAARGAAYDAGPAGVMISVFPLSIEELKPIAERTGVEIANLNSPQQHVLAGERAAIEAAKAILFDEYSIEPVEIESRIPMHCARFRPVADVLRPALEAAPWQPAKRAYLPNVTARWISNPSAAEITELLCQHVYRPVYWRASIDLVADQFVDAVFIEVGPKAVLYNLLSPRWRRVIREKTDHPEDITTAFQSLVRRLRDAA